MKIRQSSGFLLPLLKDIAAGVMLPAGMQRPYVWQKSDVEALCDSILSGFPIGSFLMWAPGGKADLASLARGRLGPIEAAGAAQRYSYLLLDGQHRLATLAWMMASDATVVQDPSPAEASVWLGEERLVVDWGSRSLRFVPRAEAAVGLRLPAWTVVSGSSVEANGKAMQLVRQLTENEWGEQYEMQEIDSFLDFWDRCRDSFKDARTTETVIEDATVDEARHAFLRICRVGVPMDQSDFDRAVSWGAGGNAQQAQTIEATGRMRNG